MIPMTSRRYCDICGRVTIHRRRFVPLAEIDTADHIHYPVLDGRAIMPLECQEHSTAPPGERSA
jgi:hypothetical protein